MKEKAYVVVWHVRNRPEVKGYSGLISDKGLAQLRAVMANEDNPHLFHWVEEVDAEGYFGKPKGMSETNAGAERSIDVATEAA